VIQGRAFREAEPPERGILALVGFTPVTLSLVALLALGSAAFLTCSTLGTKLLRSR
jgi:hypothetical protein